MKSKSSPAIPFQVRSNYQLGMLQAPVGANYRDFPIRLSIPVAQGTHRSDQIMEVRDEKGKNVPALIRPFLFWSDGSVRVWEIWFH